MKLYIYDRVEGVTDYYHDSGGVIVAVDGDPAEYWRQVNRLREVDDYSEFNKDALANVTPDQVLDIKQVDPFIRVFPNAGCC